MRIGAYVVIGARCKIGAGTAILPHVTVGSDVAIGKEGLFHPGVRIGDRVKIGDRVIVHANVVIGSDGFSFAPDLNSPTGFTADVVVTRIHSLGNVEIGDDVEIGAGTTIDRSTLETTRIGRGTKIDNLVHIGHNVVIGESCILAGMVGISGSVTIGNRVRIAGRAGISDHVRIGEEAVIGARLGRSDQRRGAAPSCWATRRSRISARWSSSSMRAGKSACIRKWTTSRRGSTRWNN